VNIVMRVVYNTLDGIVNDYFVITASGREALAVAASRLTPGQRSCASPSPPAPAADERVLPTSVFGSESRNSSLLSGGR